MVDPANITNYNLTDAELEERVLFWVCAAGKNGTTAARCLDNLLTALRGYFSQTLSPFELIQQCYMYLNLPLYLKINGIGCYTNKTRTMYELTESGLDLKTCTVDDLEKVYGIGRKTSRCFILHSRENAQCAGLDTHMLKHLKNMGVENVPKQTPSSTKQYKRLENEVLKLARAAGLSPADYDLMIWNKYSVKSKNKA